MTTLRHGALLAISLFVQESVAASGVFRMRQINGSPISDETFFFTDAGEAKNNCLTKILPHVCIWTILSGEIVNFTWYI